MFLEHYASRTSLYQTPCSEIPWSLAFHHLSLSWWSRRWIRLFWLALLSQAVCTCIFWAPQTSTLAHPWKKSGKTSQIWIDYYRWRGCSSFHWWSRYHSSAEVSAYGAGTCFARTSILLLHLRTASPKSEVSCRDLWQTSPHSIGHP